MLTVSDDGYVRMTLSSFRAVPLRHLFSEIDQDLVLPPSTATGASAASIVGFTEWVSDTMPALSLGWDWRLETRAGHARYAREGDVRSNVMLVDATIGDLGTLATSVLLSTAVEAWDWQSETLYYITKRYGWHLSDLTATPPPPGLQE